MKLSLSSANNVLIATTANHELSSQSIKPSPKALNPKFVYLRNQDVPIRKHNTSTLQTLTA